MEEQNQQQNQQLTLNEAQAAQVAEVIKQAVGAITEKYGAMFEAMSKASHGKTPTIEELATGVQSKINERLVGAIVKNNPNLAGVNFDGVSTDTLKYIASKQNTENGKKLF